jgi:hypothetical protein
MNWTAAELIAVLSTVFISVLLAIIELRISFPNEFPSAMRTRWSWLILSANVFPPFLLLLILAQLSEVRILTGIIVPPLVFILMRTDFSLLRNFTHTGEMRGLSFDIGGIWFRAMRPLYDRVSLALLDSREKTIRMLLYRYPSTEELLEEARRCAYESPSYTRAHLDEMVDFLDRVASSDTLTETAKRVTYAKFIFHIAGREHVRRLAERRQVTEGEGNG